MLQKNSLDHAQKFLVSVIEDEEDNTRTIEVGDIKQGAVKGNVVPAAGANCQVHQHMEGNVSMSMSLEHAVSSRVHLTTNM